MPPASLPFVKDAKPTRIDALCLVLITFLSAAPYLWRLGFYSDDWAILADFHFKGVSDGFATFAARPAQGLYLAALYESFGLHPLGYHLVNTAVIAASTPLLFALLLRLGIDRRSAMATAIVFILLPQLSTVRVWYAAFQIPLSLVFALVSLHALLSFRESGRKAWLGVGLIAAIGSISAYEIFAPLIVAGTLAAAWDHPKRRSLGIGIAALLAIAVAAKWSISSRAPAPDIDRYLNGLVQLFRWDYDWRVDYGLNVFAAAQVHFWSTLEGWAKAVVSLGSPAAIASAIGVAAVTFWRMWTEPDGEQRSTGRMLVLGVAAFLLGHAAFLVVPDIMFSPTGIANRALVAAAVGVALLLVAVLSWVSAPGVFAAMIATIAFVGTIRINQIAAYWADAPGVQQQNLANATHHLRAVPANATVILDGVCPYHGPAIVFETGWDVTGALSLSLGRTVRGDVVSQRMSIGPRGLSSSIYGETQTYPYGPSLYVYDVRRGAVVALDDEAAAHRYFDDSGRPRLVCPEGYVGQGSLI